MKKMDFSSDAILSDGFQNESLRKLFRECQCNIDKATVLMAHDMP